MKPSLPIDLRTALTAGLAAVVTCAAAVFFLLALRGGSAFALAAIVPADDTLFLLRTTREAWDEGAAHLTGVFPEGSMNAVELPRSGTFDIALIRQESGETGWITHWTDGDEERLRASHPSLLASREEGSDTHTRLALAHMEAYKLASVRPQFAVMRTDLLAAQPALRDQLMASLLQDTSHVAIGWDGSKGILIGQKHVPSTGMSGGASPLQTPMADVLLHASYADPLSLMEAIADRIRHTHPDVEQGIRGILLQAWQARGGSITALQGVLSPLLLHPVTVTVTRGEEGGEAAEVLLRGTVDAGHDDAPLALLIELARMQAHGEIRTVELLRGQTYTSVVGSPVSAVEEKGTSGGWTLFGMEGDEENLLLARNGQRYAIGTHAASVRQAIAQDTERAESVRGIVSIAWLSESFSSLFPFLSEEDTAIPHALLPAAESLSWEAANQRETWTVRWQLHHAQEPL